MQYSRAIKKFLVNHLFRIFRIRGVLLVRLSFNYVRKIDFTDHVPVQQYRLFYRSYTAEEGLHNFLGWRQHQVVLEYTWPQSCNNTQICDLGEWTISMRRLGRSPGTRTIGRIPKLGTSSIVNRRRVQTPSKCACPKISTRSSDATILVACATPPVSDKASQNLASL